ncbi:Uma2 family endonuclease [Singulisphaera rosea]
MSTMAQTSAMSTEELLQLPDDDVERELIDGQLRERPMTKHNRWHSSSMFHLGYLLGDWWRRQPELRGLIVGGEAGFRLRRGPDTYVGIDVAYVSAEVLANTPKGSPFFEGPPVLAIEILSPSDTHEEVSEKVRLYLDSGSALVWLVDTDFRTVLVHRQGEEPELYNIRQELTADPYLPGLRIRVADIFQGM